MGRSLTLAGSPRLRGSLVAAFGIHVSAFLSDPATQLPDADCRMPGSTSFAHTSAPAPPSGRGRRSDPQALDASRALMQRRRAALCTPLPAGTGPLHLLRTNGAPGCPPTPRVERQPAMLRPAPFTLRPAPFTLRPNGAQGCSHGWSAARALAGAAPPVDSVTQPGPPRHGRRVLRTAYQDPADGTSRLTPAAPRTTRR